MNIRYVLLCVGAVVAVLLGMLRPYTFSDPASIIVASDAVSTPDDALLPYAPMPDVPLAEVAISLRRGSGMAANPSYSVELYGDGRAIYRGAYNVDVRGVHQFRVPPTEVARLVEMIRVNDLWSTRAEYNSDRTGDTPANTVTMRFGGQFRGIKDVGGHRAGMPAAVTELEREIDKVAGISAWTDLSEETLARLDTEGFQFSSQAGAQLLARAVANRRTRDTDGVILALLERGTPVDGVDDGDEYWAYSRNNEGSVLEEAFTYRSPTLADALIARGALETTARPDQLKINSAFRAAIVSGRIELVEKIWNVAGDAHRPALVFSDTAAPWKNLAPKIAPVTLLLSRDRYSRSAPWEGLAIARFLAARGCDLKATGVGGRTLLDIATEAKDEELAQYLREQGVRSRA
jgi:hypothetical protein